LITSRLPRRPYCADDPHEGLIALPTHIATTKSHIQLNPAHLKHWLVFDIDTPRAALSWELAHLPPPNWISVNTRNTHAHCGYLLEIPVIAGRNGHEKPLSYLAAIEAAYRLKLRADPAYKGFVCKNPLHSTWNTWFLHCHAYSLGELAEWVSLSAASMTMPDQVGVGRNVTLFDVLRKWSYHMALTYKSAGASREQWVRALLHEAEGLNSKFDTPLAFPEVRAISKSIAKWTWRHFTPERFREIQRSRAEKRWSKPRPTSLEQSKPWKTLGISRRTYFNRKKAGTLPDAVCTDALSDNSAGDSPPRTLSGPVSS
jgi:hypothetical protein